MNEDYIRTARMKGVPEKIVQVRHILKNTLVPFITILGLEVGWLLGGSVIIEKTPRPNHTSFN